MKESRMLKSIYWTLVMAVSAVSLTMCTEADNEGPVDLPDDASIVLDVTSLDVPADGGVFTVNVLSSQDWSMDIPEETGAWVSSDRTMGLESDEAVAVTITVKPNFSEERTGKVTFMSEDANAELEIIQAAEADAVTEFSDDFEEIDEDGVPYDRNGWHFYSNDTEDKYSSWLAYCSDERKTLQIYPYNSSEDQVVAYAMLPLINVKGAGNRTMMTFQVMADCSLQDDSKLEVVVSKDFNGDFETATWEVAYDGTALANSPMWWPYENSFNLGRHFGDCEELYVAFRYTGKLVGYYIDNVTFGVEEAPVIDDNIGTNWQNDPVSAFGDDFESIQTPLITYVSDNWTFWSTDLTSYDTQWCTATYIGMKFLQVTAYESIDTEVSAFAMLPPLNIADASPKTLTFDAMFDSYYQPLDGSALEVVVSDNFDGNFSAADWKVVYSITEDAPSGAWGTLSCDLSSYASYDNLYVAFRYTGHNNLYRLDNVIFGTPDNMNGGNEGSN